CFTVCGTHAPKHPVVDRGPTDPRRRAHVEVGLVATGGGDRLVVAVAVGPRRGRRRGAGHGGRVEPEPGRADQDLDARTISAVGLGPDARVEIGVLAGEADSDQRAVAPDASALQPGATLGPERRLPHVETPTVEPAILVVERRGPLEVPIPKQ